MIQTKAQRAAIYIRQSQTHEGTISPELQEKNVRRFIESQEEWTATDVYADIDVSGLKEANRPGFLKLKQDYASGKFDIAVADEFTRFSRNAVDGISLLGTMKIATAKEGIPPEDDFMPSLYFLLSAKFSKDMGKRWRDGLTHRLRNGVQPSGKPQFGYTRHHPGEDGKPITKENPKAKGIIERYVINPGEADILREAYRRYTAGEGARTICEDFSARGLAAPGPTGWAPTGLFDLMDKIFYAGKIEWSPDKAEAKRQNKKPTILVVEGAHEPILTTAQWADYRKARESRKLQEKPRNPKWMLAGLVECGLCGGKMVSHMARGVPSLMCATYNAKGKTGCTGTFRKRAIVMRKFRYWLYKHREEWADAMPSDDEARITAETAVADAQAAYDKAMEDYSRYQQWAYENSILPAVSAQTLADKAATVTSAEAALDEAQAELESFIPASTVLERIDAGLKVLGLDVPEGDDSLGDEPDEGETAIMREIYSKLIEKIVVLPPSHPSPRHPDRNLMAEIEIHSKKLKGRLVSHVGSI